MKAPKKWLSGQHQNPSFSEGFTLVEVAIVALMVGIIAVAAIPTLSSSLEDARLTAAASEVVTAFEFAQLSAATTGRQTQAIIKSGSGRIEVKQYKIIADLFTGGDTLASADVESGTFEYMQYPLKKGTDYNIQMQDEDRFKGVEITVSSFDTGASVFFDSLGTPSKGGSVTLTLGSRQMAVTLDALTGKVTVTD